MVYGVLNLINFAHVDVLMIGAMAGLTLLKIINAAAPELSGVVQLLLAILGAIPVCVIVTVVIERIASRTLLNAPRLAPFIHANGFSIPLGSEALWEVGGT